MDYFIDKLSLIQQRKMRVIPVKQFISATVMKILKQEYLIVINFININRPSEKKNDTNIWY